MSKTKCPKCKSKDIIEIYYHLGIKREKCNKCNLIFNKFDYEKNKI